MWDLSSRETSPFDVRAGLQQAQPELAISGFNYWEAAALQLGAWGFLIIFAAAPAERRVCPSVSTLVPPPRAASVSPSLPAPPQNHSTNFPSVPRAGQSLSLFPTVRFVFVWLSLCLILYKLISNPHHQPDLGAALHCIASFRKTE